MAAHQAPPSLGFSRQEDWNGLSFPSPMHDSESEVAQSCLTLSDSMDCSLPGSSIYRIFQARVLEWGDIAFSGDAGLGLFNCVLLFAALWTVTCQAPLFMGFSRQEYWRGLLCPLPRGSSQPRDQTQVS